MLLLFFLCLVAVEPRELRRDDRDFVIFHINIAVLKARALFIHCQVDDRIVPL